MHKNKDTIVNHRAKIDSNSKKWPNRVKIKKFMQSALMTYKFNINHFWLKDFFAKEMIYLQFDIPDTLSKLWIMWASLCEPFKFDIIILDLPVKFEHYVSTISRQTAQRECELKGFCSIEILLV